ncbi:Ig-like domain-containing protein [Carboxydothermus pertinax]|uniref:Ig-like domain-containing protein n=1 Tax=Carboxydothermus pertinax TaxID=870242 RepID=A0A1L8CTG2_9THEO|nr:Ig-like domain-containing protein [Carboxydothermus pertinax]GAV22225.1 Ig-like domain-containing protein [Carboxydothermus pertinax]
MIRLKGKKAIAIITMAAFLLTMLPAFVLASTPAKYVLTLSPTTVKPGTTATLVSGSVVDIYGNKGVVNIVYTTPAGTSDTLTATLADGTFAKNYVFDQEGDYAFQATDGSDVSNVVYVLSRYDYTPDARGSYKVGDTNVILGGTIKGLPAGRQMVLQHESVAGVYYTSAVTDTGRFAISVPVFTYAGTYALGTANTDGSNFVKYEEITVAPQTLTVTADKTALTGGSFDNNITFTAKPAVTVSGGTYYFELSGVKIDKNSVTGTIYGTVIDSTYYTKVAVADTDGVLNLANLKVLDTTGTLTVKAYYQKDSVGFANGLYTDNAELLGTLTIPVNPAAKVNVFANLTSLSAATDNSLTIDVRDVNNAAYGDPNSTLKAVQVTVTGPNVNLSDSNKGSFSFTVIPSQAGTVTVTVVATLTDNTQQTQTLILPVTGLKASLDATTVANLVYSKTISPQVTVTDVNGTPINNAKVTISGSYNGSIDGKTTNILNGQYNFIAAPLTDVTPVTVTVYDASGNVAAEVSYPVLGSNVYTVTPDKATLIAGYDTQVSFTVKEGAYGVTDNVNVAYTDLNGTSQTVNGVTYSNGKYTVSLGSLTKAGTLNFKVLSTDGKKYGTFTVNVKLPVIKVFAPADGILTDSQKEAVSYAVYSPVDNTELTANTTVTLNVYDNSATFGVYDVNGNALKTVDGSAYNTGAPAKVTVLATKNASYGYDGKLQLLVNGIKISELTVKPAVLTVNKTEVAVGTDTAVEATLKDAHGNAIKDATVTLNGTGVALTGTTDAEGKVIFTVMPFATGKIVVDAPAYANITKPEITAKFVVDDKKPVITIEAPATTDKDTVDVNIKVTDEGKVAGLLVNGQRIELVAPMVEVNKVVTVTLKEGKNTITVEAADVAGNIATATADVTYTKPVVTTGDKYSKFVGQMVKLTYSRTNLRVAPNGKLLVTLQKGYKMRYLGREGVWNKVRVSIWMKGGYKTYTGYIYDPYFWALTKA